MDKARRILSGGWLSTAVSAFTRGFYLIGGGLDTVYEPGAVNSPAGAGVVSSPASAGTAGSPQATGTVKGR